MRACTLAPTLCAAAVALPGSSAPVAPLRFLARPRVVDLPVLLYHRVDTIHPWLPPVTRRLTVDPRTFARQMEWLVADRRHAVTPLQVYDALERGRPLPPRPVLITFDDGYRDVLGKAAPVLRRLGLHALDFAIAGRVSGPDPSFLTWPELLRLRRDGIAIGSHTVTHRDLATLAPAELRRELVDSRRTLERHLRAPVQWLAYPYGRVDAAVVAAARAAGYVLAWTETPGVRQDGAEPLLLHRDEVQEGTSLARLLGG